MEEKKQVLRRIGICEKYDEFMRNGKTKKLVIIKASGSFLLCMRDKGSMFNRTAFPKVAFDDKQYEGFDVPTNCLYFTEQCLENWNEKKTLDGC